MILLACLPPKKVFCYKKEKVEETKSTKDDEMINPRDEEGERRALKDARGDDSTLVVCPPNPLGAGFVHFISTYNKAKITIVI